MVQKSIKEKYFQLLKAHASEPEEKLLLEAGELGRALVVTDTPPEEIGEMHEEALKRLAHDHHDARAVEAIRSTSAPLMEILMAYGLAFRYRFEQQKALEEQMRHAARMESIGRLAGGVAHDFNNILTAIIGYTQILLTRRHEDPDIPHYLTEIRGLGRRAAALTRKLLAFGRRLPRQPVVLNINSVIEGGVELLRRLIGEGIDMEFAPAPDLWSVWADPAQIEEVFISLAINSCDAMSKGGKLTVETANIVLEGHHADGNVVATPGHYVILAVSDTGCGVDRNVQEHMFEPFFTTKQGVNGDGLGLASTYGIVKEHRGHIEVHSQLGKGTDIKIYLPRADAEPGLSSEKATLPEVPGRVALTRRTPIAKVHEALQK